MDPIFHLTIPPSVYEKGFVEASQAGLKACGIVVRRSASYRYWILASTGASGTKYLMIAGLVKDGPAALWSDGTQGAFLELQDNICTQIGPLDQVFPYYQYETDGNQD